MSSTETKNSKAARFSLGGVGRALNELTIVVGFVAISLYLAITTPAFLSTANILSILLASSLIGIVAVGETFVIVTSGIDLSVGSVVAFTGVMTGLAIHAHVPVPLAVLTGIGIGACCGAFIAFAITVLNMSPFIVTLAVLAMARGLAFIVTSGNTIFDFPDSFDNIGGGNLGPVPIAALIAAAVFLLAWVVLSRTVLGAEIYAVGGNREAARLAGIPVNRTLAIVYIISGALAGLGGVVLAGRLDSAQPIAAVGLELNAIAAVVIGGASLFGGKGSMLGTLLGVLIIGLINNGLTLKNVQPFWVQFIQGAVIFGAVLIDSLNQKRRGRV
ncbi:ABC transporter permease [Lichenicoccus sp.]|uniref:ABC transporter permease n=1 Tax=Lichenicoccus sp. TaxID=2781899 RepID=UPI003D0C7AFD